MSLVVSDVIESPLVLVGNMFEHAICDQPAGDLLAPGYDRPPKPSRSVGGFSFEQSSILTDPSERHLYTRAHFCPPNAYASAAALQEVAPSETDISGVDFRPSLALLRDTEPQRRAHAIRQTVPGLPAELCQIITSYLFWTLSLPPPLSSTKPVAAAVSVPLVRAFGVLMEWHQMTPTHYRHSFLTAYITAIEELEEPATSLTAFTTAQSTTWRRVCVTAQPASDDKYLAIHVPERAYEHFVVGFRTSAAAGHDWLLRCVPTSAPITRSVADTEWALIPSHCDPSGPPNSGLSMHCAGRVLQTERVHLYSTQHWKAVSGSAAASTTSHAPQLQTRPLAAAAADQKHPKLVTRSEPTPMLSAVLMSPANIGCEPPDDLPDRTRRFEARVKASKPGFWESLKRIFY
jgi:hypothetical protein